MSEQYNSVENKVENWHRYQNDLIQSLSSPASNNPQVSSDSDKMAQHSRGGCAIERNGFNCRLDSVEDEELFGPQASDSTIDTNDVFSHTDLDETRSDKDQCNINYSNVGALPNFDLLDESSGKSSDENPEFNFGYPKSLETPEKFNSGSSGNGSIGINSEDLKSILRHPSGRMYERSQSATDKRDSYRNSRERKYAEIDSPPDFDENFLKNQPIVRKSNSLPDLVTTSQPQSLSPRTCPDVAEIQFHSEGWRSAGSRQKQREAIEGRSWPSATSRPKGIVRHISIAETTEELLYNTEDEPNMVGKEGRQLTSRDRTEEVKLPLKSPSVERRQVLASKSSGYHTGSEGNGSQEKNDDAFSRSTSQISSTVFTSQESEDKGRELEMGKQLEAGKICFQQYTESREPEVGEQLEITVVDNQLKNEQSFEIDVKAGVLAGNLPLVSMQSLNEYGPNEETSEMTYSSEISGEILDSMNNSSWFESQSESLFCSYDSEKTTSNHGNNSPHSSGSSTLTVIDAVRGKESLKSKEQSVREYFHHEEKAISMTEKNLPCMSFTQEDLYPRGDGKIAMESDGKSTELKNSSANSRVVNNEESSLDITGIFEAGAIRKQTSMVGESFSITDNVERLAEEDDKKIQKFKRKQNLTSSGSMDTMRSSSSDSPSSVRERLSDQEVVFSASDLERASRCASHKCPDPTCKKLLEVNVALQSEILDSHSSYPLVRLYCMGLWEHAQKKLSACGEDDLTSQIVFRIQAQMNIPKTGMFLQDEFKFHKFASLDYHHHMSLFTRLQRITHKHIVDQLWLLEYNDQVQVCSPVLPGGSLRDYLDNQTGGLPWEQAIFYLNQAIDAVLYLHTKGVVYLNWQTEPVRERKA
ncbi:hypothetical protein MAR_018253 [Mya arenaria]|uniref:Protein kinase domain-containing protein n=1 Tax=Mya arenaria TaxID=6604 RepID=A0ABY7EEJ1_MYAAR|nr:hypothetical protein MAR_018253 [Mya arenaria]